MLLFELRFNIISFFKGLAKSLLQRFFPFVWPIKICLDFSIENIPAYFCLHIVHCPPGNRKLEE